MPRPFAVDFADRLSRFRTDSPALEASRQAAVAALLRTSADGPELLLMTRAVRPGDRWSGQVSLPGGHVERVDADLQATAVRETHEELGIDLAACAAPLCRLEPVQAMARGQKIDLAITPFAFVQRKPAELRPGVEALDGFWFPLGPAARGELDGEYPYRKGEVLHRLPCWNFEERVVWGLTHRMVTRLIDLIR